MRVGGPFLRAAVVLCTSIAPFAQFARTAADDNIRRAELSQNDSSPISGEKIPWAFSADPSGSGWHLSAPSNGSSNNSLEDCSEAHQMGSVVANSFSENCPTRSLQVFVGYDSWREYSDGNWQNNGIQVGVNWGTRLGQFSDLTGLGFQIGGSIGVDDWAGTNYRLVNLDKAETQGFVTFGFFRRADDQSNWSAAIVNDWMFNDTFSVYGQDPMLSQLRGQFGYAINEWNELGLWGACRVRGDTIDVPAIGPVTWRPLDQLSLFWRHKWARGGADTAVWAGMPENNRLAGGGSLGDYLAGASAHAPLGDRVALYTLVTYMHCSSRPGPAGAMEEAWNFSVGLAFYPRGNSRSGTVAGRSWTPLLPVANNGYFLVDASSSY